MAIRKIIVDPDPGLRAVSVPVLYGQNPAQLDALIHDMIETCHEADGIGLAAIQVGIAKRVIVMKAGEWSWLELINPSIVRHSDETTSELVEGCLSVPGRSGRVERWAGVEVEYALRPGVVRRQRFSGLDAIVIQHELDHLDGKLFIDELVEG